MSREEIELKAEASSAAGNPENSELKMITFTLADKDYGIDIMQVKEISRMMEFTYIPNDLKEVTPEERETINKMVDRLEEFDDVQTVYTNMKPEEA